MPQQEYYLIMNLKEEDEFVTRKISQGVANIKLKQDFELGNIKKEIGVARSTVAIG